MSAPVQIGNGITVGGHIRIGPAGIYAGQTTAPATQNVADSDGTVGFFFTGTWSNLTEMPNLNNIEPGWTVDQIPGATVVTTDPVLQTVTITGGIFESGEFYTFTGV
jgi:hypothetical protein